MELVVGTESTWSLRAWLCAKMVNLDITEIVIDLSSHDAKAALLAHSPTGLVPVLKADDLVIHDSLAITEYINELTNGALYPLSLEDRAIARSLCAELHSGFTHLRTCSPFTLESVPHVTDLPYEVQQELARIEAIFAQAEGEFMFSLPSAVDAFYSVMAYRLQSYGIYLMGDAGHYQQNLLSWPLLRLAIKTANEWRANTRH